MATCRGAAVGHGSLLYIKAEAAVMSMSRNVSFFDAWTVLERGLIVTESGVCW